MVGGNFRQTVLSCGTQTCSAASDSTRFGQSST
jgi:hypothetical protein